MSDSERPLAVLASGSGSTAEPLFPFTRVVVSSRKDAGVIDRVARYNEQQGHQAIAVEVVRRRDYLDYPTWGEALTQRVVHHGSTYASLNGWGLLLPGSLLAALPTVNSHPGRLDYEHRLLLPAYLGEVEENIGKDPLDFGGLGMHGLTVHEATRLYNEWTDANILQTEVTLHLLDPDKYDNGPTLARTSVLYEWSDSAEQIQERVKVIERHQNEAFWRQVIEAGKLPPILPREEPLIPERHIGTLWQARRKGKYLYP